MKPESLAQKTTRSAAWLFGQKILTNLIGLGSVAILARQLDPSDFGIVALAGVVINFAFAYGKATTGKYVIYDRKDGWEERAHSAFWLNLTLVGVTILIALPLLPFIAQFFDEPMLQLVLIVILFRIGVDQISVVPDALIRRKLDYQKLVLRNSSLQIIAALLSVLMAISGFGVWSLIIPSILIAIPKSIIAMWMASWYPKLPLRTQYWREIFNYTKYIMGRTMLGAFLNDADTLVIGRLLGSSMVGIYDRAWQSSNLITKNITWVLSDVAMPSFSSLTSRPDALQRAFSRMLLFLGVVTTPLLIGMFVLADDFILTLYGPKWLDSVIILQIFIFYTIIRSITSPVGTIFDSTGRPDIPFKTRISVIPFLFLSIFIGTQFGLIGVAIAVVIYKILTAFLILFLACQLIDLPYFDVLSSIWLSIEPSIIMGVSVWFIKYFLNNNFQLSHIANLIIITLVGGMIYLLLLRTLPRYAKNKQEILFALESIPNPLTRSFRKLLQGNNYE